MLAAVPGVAFILKEDFTDEWALGSSVSWENEGIRSGVYKELVLVGLVGVQSKKQLCGPKSLLCSNTIELAGDSGGKLGNANPGNIILRDEVDIAARVFHDWGDTLAILNNVVACDNT